jgi:hypothetical protein
VLESYTHIYDFDQSVRVAGCRELRDLLRAEDVRREAQATREHELRERVRNGDSALIRERFLAALEKQGTVGDPTAFGEKNRAPLPGDWAQLRDEIIALGDSAFAEPTSGSGPLATLLFSATGAAVDAVTPKRRGGKRGGRNVT